MLHVQRRPTEIYLSRLEIHPAYQGQGIGTRILTTLMRQAAQQNRSLVLDVLAGNERAHAFYQRLGRHDIARHDSGAETITMSTDPPSPANVP